MGKNSTFLHCILCIYKKFLKSGCSDTPIELLKIAGVDMSKKEPVELAMKMFEELLDEFERSTDK